MITNAVGPRSVSLREMMRRAVRTERELNNSNSTDQHGFVQEEPIPTHSWPPESFDVTSGDEDSLMGLGSSANKGTSNSMPSLNNTSVLDPNERRNNAMQILHDLLYESTALAPHLIELLCAKYVLVFVFSFYMVLKMKYVTRYFSFIGLNLILKFLYNVLEMLRDKHRLCSQFHPDVTLRL